MAGRTRGPLVGIGHATLDFLGLVERPPEGDTKTELLAASFQGGGPAATATATAALLGAEARFVGKVAGDEFGRLILEQLRGAGVDVESCVVDPGGRMSPFAFIQVHAGERTIWYTHGDVAPLAPGEVDPVVLEGAALLLVDGHQAEAQIAAAEQARARGVPVLLDAGSVRAGMPELVRRCDVLIASERFAAETAPRGELEDGLEELARLGPSTVIVTLGEGGSVGRTATREGVRRVVEPAFAAGEIVDTTGAGDVYHGAYAYAMLEGWPIDRAMHFASIAAGLSCRTLGGRAGVPRLADVLERM